MGLLLLGMSNGSLLIWGFFLVSKISKKKKLLELEPHNLTNRLVVIRRGPD